jgi:hypothetical protein
MTNYEICDYIHDKNKEYIIIDIGTKDCHKSIQFYKTFPNAKIYIFDCDENTLELCENNIKHYTDRITLIKEAVFNYDLDIDICYMNEHNFSFIQNKVSLNKVKILCNKFKILYDNSVLKLEMYCIYHKNYYFREDNFYFTFFGVNEVYPKIKNCNNILEYQLEKYNPFLQKRGYMETSVYLHVYWNKLYKNKDMIGFSQYDMRHNFLYNNLNKNTIYFYSLNNLIIKDGQWNKLMFPETRNLDFLIKSYNKHFVKNYSIKELESKTLSLLQTNIYPVIIYEKLCSWLEKLVDEIYPWCNIEPYDTNFGSIGGYTERALSIFNAFEIYEGINYNILVIEHGIGCETKEQYNPKSFLNNYTQDIYTKYIDNITGKHNVDYCMFNAECYFNNVKYNCERINKNNKDYLYFSKSDKINIIEKSFDIEGEDPRIFIFNNNVYVIFITFSPYPGQSRCIGITLFDEWKPIFLQIENMKHNPIEKNWAPFVCNNKLYFVYNYDPLIIIHYDLNNKGICNIVYKQEGVILPINTSNTFLRGGSNLIQYKDHYYIGGCHSRIYDGCYQHYSHIILLDTLKWKIVYLSKAVMYNYTLNNKLNAWNITYSHMIKEMGRKYNILNDKSPHIIQDPISLYVNGGKYYITINVRDAVTLKYEIHFKNLLDLKEDGDKKIGYWDNLTKKYAFLVNNI